MNDSPNSTALCLLATEILSSTYEGIVTVEVLVGSLAIVPNILLLQALYNVTIFPSNLRLLLAHFSIALLLYSMSAVLKGIYLLTTDPCAFSLTMRECKVIETLTTLHLPNIFYSLFSIFIERVYATVNYRKYDKTQMPWLGMFLIIFSWSAMSYTILHHSIDIPIGQYVPFCDSTFIPYVASPHLFIVYMCLEWVGICATGFMFYYNRRLLKCAVINRAQFNLSSRFLVHQNVQVNALLVPSVAAHFIIHLSTFALLIPITVGVSVSVEMKIVFTRASFLLRLFYAVIDPIMAFIFNEHLRRHLLNGPVGGILKRFGVHGKETETATPPASQSVIHFAYLNTLWTSKPELTKKMTRKRTGKVENGEK